jgi:hypothetical protein
MNASPPHTRPSSSAKADDPVFQSVGDGSRSCGVLDTPLEPVIGLAGGETRWRGMTAIVEWRCASPLLRGACHRPRICATRWLAMTALKPSRLFDN